MSTVCDEIAALPCGARFLRADLHIHSFGASHDVKDTSMTPAAIVDTAVSEGLGLIALTDHNEICNVLTALKAADGKPAGGLRRVGWHGQGFSCPRRDRNGRAQHQ